MRHLFFWMLSITMLPLAGLTCPAQQPETAAKSPGTAPYIPLHTFDQRRDAAADIRAAIAEAQRTHKRIILDIGGNWCPFCGELKRMFYNHPDLLKLRDENFITVYVFFSQQHKNREALAPYGGKVPGIPHYFVLNSDGKLLHSQPLLELRVDQAYSPDRMKQFLLRWAPPATTASTK